MARVRSRARRLGCIGVEQRKRQGKGRGRSSKSESRAQRPPAFAIARLDAGPFLPHCRTILNRLPSGDRGAMQEFPTRLPLSGARRAMRTGGLALALLAGAVGQAGAANDTQFTVRYTVRLAILPFTFATGTVTGTLPGDKGRYSLDFDAKGPSFTMNGKSSGVIQAGAVWPVSSVIA